MTGTSNPSVIELHAGELRLALRPDLGGCIAGFWLGGLAVLCSTDPKALEASRPSGGFPLVPYSNRLGFRRFRWQGKDYTTASNWPDKAPHSLHGVAWLRAWEVVGSTDATAELRYTHVPDEHWPFAFSVTQSFALTAAALEVRLAITNTSEEAQPVGLGWHPYFPKRERSRLHVEVAERWESDPGTQLPTRHVAQSGIDAEVKHLDFDNCFQGWTGAARLRDEKMSVRLTSSLDYLVVFTPQERDFYCVEPVSHVNNAIHMADPLAHGIVALPAGQTHGAWMKIAVDKA
jgi:aldose 1-epimerase